MAHKLKVKFENGVMSVKVDNVDVPTIKTIVLKSTGTSITANLTHNSFNVDLTSAEGEIEFVIPESLAKALK